MVRSADPAGSQLSLHLKSAGVIHWFMVWLGFFCFFFLRSKAERFPASVVNVSLFGKQCWLTSLSNCAKLKRQLKKKIDFGDFPWTQFFNEKFSGKEAYCLKPTQSKNPFACYNLPCIAFFTSEINLTVFIFLAERFLVHVFKNPSYPFRTSDVTNGFL